MAEEETQTPETPEEARAKQLADAEAEAKNKETKDDPQGRAEKLGEEILNPSDAEQDLGGDEPRGATEGQTGLF
jgi:hypothetical protein